MLPILGMSMQRYDKVDRQNLPLGISGGTTLLDDSNLSNKAIKQ